MEDFISAAEAAAIIGVNDSRVRQLLRAKLLEGRHHGRDWLIRRVDAERFKRTKPGPKPKRKQNQVSRQR